MKAILEFDLSKVEDQEEHNLAQSARKLENVLNDFYNQSLRRRLKYEDMSAVQSKLVEEIRKEFFSCLEAYNLDL